jgi:hypothetical protein
MAGTDLVRDERRARRGQGAGWEEKKVHGPFCKLSVTREIVSGAFSELLEVARVFLLSHQRGRGCARAFPLVSGCLG